MNAALSYLSMPSPIGALTLFAEGGALTVIEHGRAPDMEGEPEPVLLEARRQLDAYFDGKLKTFDLPLAPAGTEKQKAIWQALRAIPYGETATYGDLARRAGSGPRAVGMACGANPLPLVVPCHRVLGAGGTLGGYSFADGVETKKQLLTLEGVPV